MERLHSYFSTKAQMLLEYKFENRITNKTLSRNVTTIWFIIPRNTIFSTQLFPPSECLCQICSYFVFVLVITHSTTYLNLNISMDFLHTVLYAFPVVPIRRICLQELLEFEIISFILMTLMFDLRLVLLGEIGCLSLWGVRGLIFRSFSFR